MLSYLIRRILIMVPTLFLISVVTFVVIELPPGDYVSRYVEFLEAQGRPIDEEILDNLRHRYGLDKPAPVRYLSWIGNVVRGDFGYSIEQRKPVAEILRSRFAMTVLVTLSSMLFAWVLAFPIGIYSAVHQYSTGDYVFTVIGFLGMAIPNFLFALVLMFLGAKVFGISVGGLFSREFQEAGWSVAKVLDLAKHLWIPMVVIGTAGTAGLIRVLRANLLDELRKPYVDLARAKGLPEGRLILKYPLRIAINPFVSSIGWILPSLISGAVITAVVLDLPSAGPIFLRALRTEPKLIM